MGRSVVASDNFNRADGAPGSDWSQVRPATGTVEILSNEVRNITGNAGVRWVGAGSFSGDQYSAMKFRGLGGTGQTVQVWVRVSADVDGARDYYFAQVVDGGLFEAGSIINGSASIIFSTGTYTFNNEDELSIEVVDGHVVAMINGSEIGSFDDANLTTGVPGFGFIGTGAARGDDWSGGDMVSDGPRMLFQSGVMTPVTPGYL